MKRIFRKFGVWLTTYKRCWGKPMTQVFPYRLNWYRVQNYRFSVLAEKVVVVLAGFGLAAGILSGTYKLGQMSVDSKITYAKQEIEIVKEVKVGIKFEEIPMLVKICQAESGSRQFNKDGSVIRGRVNPSDIGFCQINEYINNDEARKLGYDIFTEEGNKGYAVYLFLHRGTAPWNSSKEIWSKI